MFNLFSDFFLEPGILGTPVRHDGFSFDGDIDMKRGLLRHDLNMKRQGSCEPPLILRPLNQGLLSPIQPNIGLLAQRKYFSPIMPVSTPTNFLPQSSQRNVEVCH